jgi:uncharacterized membrane protein YccC
MPDIGDEATGIGAMRRRGARYPRFGLKGLFVFVSSIALGCGAMALLRTADTGYVMKSSQGLLFAFAVLSLGASIGAPIGHLINRSYGALFGALLGGLLIPPALLASLILLWVCSQAF